MKCMKPIWIENEYQVPDRGQEVPCGRCPACVERKRSVWTFRLLQELRVSESAYFVTLTYKPEEVPTIKKWHWDIMTLDKKDVQNFNKSLRKEILKDGDTRYLKRSEKTGNYSPKYRYYAAGEYGGKTDRPHVHILMYNLPLDWVKYDPIHDKKYSTIIEDI